MRSSIGDAVASLLRDGHAGAVHGVRRQRRRPADAEVGLELVNQRGLSYLLTAPGDLGMARAYVAGDLRLHGVHPGDPYDALGLLRTTCASASRPRPRRCALVARAGARPT